MYLNEATLEIPAFDVTMMPGIGELFVWQWRYWVVSDVIGAVAAAHLRLLVVADLQKQMKMERLQHHIQEEQVGACMTLFKSE